MIQDAWDFFLIFYKSDDSMIHYVHYAKMVMIQDGHDRNRKWVCFKQNGDDTQDGCNKWDGNHNKRWWQKKWWWKKRWWWKERLSWYYRVLILKEIWWWETMAYDHHREIIHKGSSHGEIYDSQRQSWWMIHTNHTSRITKDSNGERWCFSEKILVYRCWFTLGWSSTHDSWGDDGS